MQNPSVVSPLEPETEVGTRLQEETRAHSPKERSSCAVSAEAALTLRCIELLKASDVKTFNEIRPKGRLDLSTVDLSGTNLAGVNFDDVILSRANLERVYMPGASLQRAQAEHACFDDATLDGSIVGGNASFKHATFTRAFARKVDFQFSDLTNSELIDTQLQGSNLSNAIFADAKLTRANLTGAVAVKSWFLGANLNNTIFHRANLEQAYFVQSRGKDIDFSEANLCRTKFLCTLYSGEKLSFKGAYTKGWMADDFGFSLYAAMPKIKKNEGDEPALSEPTPQERLRTLLKDNKPHEPEAGTYNQEIKKLDEAALVNGVPGSNIKLYQEALKELDALVGLKKVKDVIHEVANFLTVNEWRRQQGLKPLQRNLHFVFTGNPGTGKTTIARILAKIFTAVGYLPSDELVETDRSGMVAGYVGQTEEKASKLIARSMGKLLFIDEAYQLASAPGSNDYGDEAIAILLKQMEDNRGKFIVVVAGYPGPMKKFIESNPGLKSRFTEYNHFDDYDVGELTEIGKRMYDKLEYVSTPEFLAACNAMYYMQKVHTGKDFGNGRDVRNIFEKSSAMQSTRLANAGLNSRDALTHMQIADLPTQQYLELRQEEIPWKELRWVDKSGKELDLHHFPLSAEYPELSDDSKKLLDTLALGPQEFDLELEELSRVVNG